MKAGEVDMDRLELGKLSLVRYGASPGVRNEKCLIFFIFAFFLCSCFWNPLVSLCRISQEPQFACHQGPHGDGDHVIVFFVEMFCLISILVLVSARLRT
jgi:hypothetical protein